MDDNSCVTIDETLCKYLLFYDDGARSFLEVESGWVSDLPEVMKTKMRWGDLSRYCRGGGVMRCIFLYEGMMWNR